MQIRFKIDKKKLSPLPSPRPNEQTTSSSNNGKEQSRHFITVLQILSNLVEKTAVNPLSLSDENNPKILISAPSDNSPPVSPRSGPVTPRSPRSGPVTPRGELRHSPYGYHST